MSMAKNGILLAIGGMLGAFVAAVMTNDEVKQTVKETAEACKEFAQRANASYEVMIQYWKDYQIDALDQFVTTSDPDLLVSQIDGYISSACGLHVVDTAVSIIVREEIQAYFAGDKTIEEVMEIIQNRVDLCMNERG